MWSTMHGEDTSDHPSMTEPAPSTFVGLPRLDELPRPPHVTFLGVPYGRPYRGLGPELPSATAPAALRAASLAFQPYYRNVDVDFGGDLFAGREVLLADAGDVRLVPGDHTGNLERITTVVRILLRAGTVPIVLGGDHAVTVPVLQAYAEQTGLCIVQIDAHLDWRDEVDGIREGFSSPMRRASELSSVHAMIQIGLRGAGSGREEEFAAARTWGSVLVPARTVHREGIEWVLDRLPQASAYYVTLDADGIDPGIMPGVNAPAPGGLTYWQVFDLLCGIAHRGQIVGFDLTELAPARDPSGVTVAHAVRILLVLIGALAHAGQFG